MKPQYIYLIQTKNYVKYGITDRPRPRLREHAVEVDQDLSYHSIWKVESGDYEKVEAEVGRLLAGYHQHSKERIEVPIEKAVAAVHRAAAKCRASLVILPRKISVKRPRRHNRVSIRLSPDEADQLKSCVSGLFRGLPDMARHAVLEFIKERKA